MKQLDEFGGWLRFFQVIAIVNLLVAALALGMAIFFLFDGPPDPTITYGHLITAAVVSIPFAGLMAVIITKLPVRNIEIPRKLARTTWSAFVLTTVSTVLQAAITTANSNTSFIDAYDWPAGIFWLIAFIVYLEHSKRVKAYYGANYPERDPNTPKYLADPIGEMVEGWKNRPGQKK